MAYVDTSLLVAALTREVRTTAAQKWLASQPSEQLVISDWAITEFSAALSMKLRIGHLDEQTRAEALAVFNSLVRDSFTVIPVSHDDYISAASLADRHTSGLRAGDALHLGVASRLGEIIISLDRGLIKAALAMGINAELL